VSPQVVDQAIDSASFEALRSAVEQPLFPWEHSAILKGEFPHISADDNRQDVHGLFLWHQGKVFRSPYLPLVAPLIAQFEPCRLIKAKLNRTRSRDRHIEYGLHVDTHRSGALTVVFYLNDNNGYTLFEDGSRVMSRANRMVVFNASTRHTGASCTDAPHRLVLNLNLIPGAAKPRREI
jgi:hypothetical protein